MFWESSGVVGFDLGPLLEGQMRTANLKSAYNNLHRFSDALGLVSFVKFIYTFNDFVEYTHSTVKPFNGCLLLNVYIQ